MERDPTAVLQEAIRGVVERFPELREDQAATGFEPAKAFTGSKRGFFFGTGPQGTGYYPDPLAPLPKEDGKARPVVDAEELLREAEEQINVDEVQLLDAKSLKRHVAIFEKKEDMAKEEYLFGQITPFV